MALSKAGAFSLTTRASSSSTYSARSRERQSRNGSHTASAIAGGARHAVRPNRGLDPRVQRLTLLVGGVGVAEAAVGAEDEELQTLTVLFGEEAGSLRRMGGRRRAHSELACEAEVAAQRPDPP
jgi:hypothetical protein